MSYQAKYCLFMVIYLSSLIGLAAYFNSPPPKEKSSQNYNTRGDDVVTVELECKEVLRPGDLLIFDNITSTDHDIFTIPVE